MSKQRKTDQPYLDSLFNAAVECTGQDMPGNWEWKGSAHLKGTCKHGKKMTPPPTKTLPLMSDDTIAIGFDRDHPRALTPYQVKEIYETARKESDAKIARLEGLVDTVHRVMLYRDWNAYDEMSLEYEAFHATNRIRNPHHYPDAAPVANTVAVCELCGKPMPKGEQMFKFHGYSGPCP